jgi:hypothetical protein
MWKEAHLKPILENRAAKNLQKKASKERKEARRNA